MDNLERLLRSLFHLGVMALSQEIGMNAKKALAEAIERRDLGGIFGSALVYGGAAYAFQSSGRSFSRLVGNPNAGLPSLYHLDDTTRKNEVRRLSRYQR